MVTHSGIAAVVGHFSDAIVRTLSWLIPRQSAGKQPHEAFRLDWARCVTSAFLPARLTLTGSSGRVSRLRGQPEPKSPAWAGLFAPKLGYVNDYALFLAAFLPWMRYLTH